MPFKVSLGALNPNLHLGRGEFEVQEVPESSGGRCWDGEALGSCAQQRSHVFVVWFYLLFYPPKKE